MIDQLYLYNFNLASRSFNSIDIREVDEDFLELQSPLPSSLPKECFILKTCQRQIVLSTSPLSLELSQWKYEKHQGPGAYQFLLEVICGLKSQLLGENEIVSQFKKSMEEYLFNSSRHKSILIVLEKLLQDAKKIRTEYLSHLGQQTYASVTRRYINSFEKIPSILIIGTGQLAEELLLQFKKTHLVTICGRDNEKLLKWQKDYGIQILEWFNTTLMKSHPLIVNTVGVDNLLLFNADFFLSWQNYPSKLKQKIFIDLGAPTSIEVPPIKLIEQNLHICLLQGILNQGAILEDKKMEMLNLAKVAIEQMALKRTLWFDQKISRDQLHFFAVKNLHRSMINSNLRDLNYIIEESNLNGSKNRKAR